MRVVDQGNRTTEGIHFIISATSMAGGIAVKLVFSFCAGKCWSVYSCDFTKALFNPKVGKSDIAIEPPELPPEMVGGEFGTQRGQGKVGLLKRALYGLKDSPRLWQQTLMCFLIDVVYVRVLVSDRNLSFWHGADIAWPAVCLLVMCSLVCRRILFRSGL